MMVSSKNSKSNALKFGLLLGSAFVVFLPVTVQAQGPDQSAILQQLQSMGAIPTPGDNVQPTPAPQVAAPSQGDLNTPQDDVLTDAPSGPTPAANAGPAQGANPDEELFFDSKSLVPQSEMSTKGTPRKLSPRTSPASRFVLVRKNYEAGSTQADIVAADRALKLGRFDSALDIYNRLYESNKTDPNVILGRAVTLQKLERYDEAISAYEELLDIKPDNIEAHTNMLGLLAQRYPAVAIQKLKILQKDNPNNGGISSQIAVAYAQLGRYNDAIRHLGFAASMDPRNPGHVYNMAIIADKAGDHAQAVGLYEQALEIDTIYGGGRSIPREDVFQRLAQIR